MQVTYKGAVVTGSPKEVAELLGFKKDSIYVATYPAWVDPPAKDPVRRPVLNNALLKKVMKRHKKPRPRAKCEFCGRGFLQKFPNQRFCSCSCAGKFNANKRYGHEYKETIEARSN